MALSAVAGGLLGAIAGSQGRESSQSTRRRLGAADEFEVMGGDITKENLGELQGLMGQSFGSQDVEAGTRASRLFADDLAMARERGGAPTEQQFGFARQLLNPERVAMNQALEDEQRRIARIAGQTGRSQDDPVLANMLAQQRVRGEQGLAARETSTAMGVQDRQLQLSQQLANVRQGLASQAMQNRMTLLNLGNTLQQQGRNFRLGSATTTTTQQSGGGLQGAILGGIGGMTAGMNIAQGFSTFGGGSTAAAPSTQMGAPMSPAGASNPFGNYA